MVESARVIRLLLCAVLCVVGSAGFAQEYEGKTLVKPSLVAAPTAVVPGEPFEVGLLLEMAPGWHSYWQYAGDAGLPTTIAWNLPDGFVAGPIKWPLPRRFLEPGDIEAYAYKDKVLLITTIVPPAGLKEKTVTLRAVADWLVCEEICVPGTAPLEITLPVAAESMPAHAELFSHFRSQLPSAEAPPFPLHWKRTVLPVAADGTSTTEGASSTESLLLTVSDLSGTGVTSVDFFPLPREGQQINHPKGGTVVDGVAAVAMETEGVLHGVLVAETATTRRGWLISSASSTETASDISQSAIPNPQSRPSLWMALFYGFVGGLILNLMPCVLPVISLKIFGFMRQAGEHPEKILRHGLAFVGGIFLWFLGLGLLVVVLKSAGSEVTWAFQFQNPWFNVAIASLVFVFALNLFGVFEIILPGRAANALSEASAAEGYAGSFAQGIFATVLATPCTAPFLGAALGFAFSQPAGVIMTMFACVAFGMALPYLLLSAHPGWMKILPKPGPWMERLKQFMGFPLLATLLWFFYILGHQKGLDGVVWAGCFLLCLAMACWIYGAFCGPLSSRKTHIVSLLLIILIVGGGGLFFLGEKFANSRRPDVSLPVKSGGIEWVPFTQEILDKLLAEGKPVFVDFTADWCISCKYNERAAIDVPAVREAFRESGIVAVKADWTNANPEITAALKKFGRVGVPFYVVYPAGNADAPIILPELLTPQIVLDALERATNVKN